VDIESVGWLNKKAGRYGLKAGVGERMERRGLRRWLQRLFRNQRGGLLLESLVAIGLLTTVFSAAVSGLSTGSRGVATFHEITTAQNLARSQLQKTNNDPYCAAPCSYTAIATPPGYTVTAEAQVYSGADANLETIVVTVYHEGQPVASVEGIKANR